ncbi:hypothetical protein RND81_01G103000 [Saponaria officinalis]|uniref:BHLH domain-containing protein n=1 Tax=Saponaria officinalis TaxID=3572 RepID=A0AAW1NHW7_SAPOF
MGDDVSSQMGYQHHSGESMFNCPSSVVNTRPMIMHPGYSSGYDPEVSLSQRGIFDDSLIVAQSELTKSSSFPTIHEIQGASTSSQMANYSSDPNFAQMLPKLSMFGSGNIRELVNPFGLPSRSQNPMAHFPRNDAPAKSGMDDVCQAEKICKVSEGRTVGVSPNGKRKRDPELHSPIVKAADGDPRKDNSGESLCSKEQDIERPKSEQNTRANSSGKKPSKQVEDNSQEEEPSKQNYIHVRARRGQATNSHSLAERVRREKISERMRLLQDLVPGCNKITGKAVMLDEIINYVQSLQHQVEFLSMKLATVNPEVNFDIERLLPKDILQSQGSGPPILWFDQVTSSSHGFPQGIHRTLTTNTTSQYHHMPQAVWDGDLQSLLQMGFHSNAGSSKTEL